MKSHHSHSALLFPLLAGAAALHTIFLLFASPRSPISDHAGFLIWWGCLALIYGVLTLLLRRPRSMQTVILVTAGMFLLQLVLTLVFAYRPSTVLSWSVLLFMWLGLYARCCGVLLDGNTPDSSATTFELSVLVLFIAAVGVSLSVMTADSLLHPIAGTLLALVAMARIRSGHTRADTQARHSQKGRLLLAGLLTVMGGLAAALCLLLTDSASRLLSRFTRWCFDLLRAIAAQVDRFLRWLLSLFPEQHMNAALLEEAQAQAPGEAAEWGSMNSMLLFYVLLGIIVLLILAILIWLWLHGGFRRITFRSPTVMRSARRRLTLLQLLRTFWERFSRAVSFQLSYLKLKNTAPGLFVWLERQMRIRHLARRSGETSRTFLLRIQNDLPSCGESLIRLADCLDQHYFGAGQTLSAGEVTTMRRQFRAELHRTRSKKTADA